MKRVLIIVSSVALACSIAALESTAGSGKVVTQTRELAEFDRIEFRLAGDFHVTIVEVHHQDKGKAGVSRRCQNSQWCGH